jgi:hypothetical protein
VTQSATMKRQLTHEELDALGIPRGDDEGTFKIGFRRDIAAAEAERVAYNKCLSASQKLQVKN